MYACFVLLLFLNFAIYRFLPLYTCKFKKIEKNYPYFPNIKWTELYQEVYVINLLGLCNTIPSTVYNKLKDRGCVFIAIHEAEKNNGIPSKLVCCVNQLLLT